MIELKITQTLKVLQLSMKKGYKYLPKEGVILGMGGKPLKLTKTGTQRYPTCAISAPGIGKETFAVPAHVFAAYYIWGEKAFQKGIQIRHRRGDVFDIRKESLLLGSAKENMSDIPPEVRSRASKAARSAQEKKIPDDTVRFIRNTLRITSEGFLLPKELERMSDKLGLPKSVISGIYRRIMYTEVKD